MLVKREAVSPRCPSRLAGSRRAIAEPGVAWAKPFLPTFARPSIHSTNNRLRSDRRLLFYTRFRMGLHPDYSRLRGRAHS